MGQLNQNLTLDARMAEFPGLMQTLPTHSSLAETLALSILKYVQTLDMTPQAREEEYRQRLTSRFAGRSVDLAIVDAIVTMAQDLHLFDAPLIKDFT